MRGDGGRDESAADVVTAVSRRVSLDALRSVAVIDASLSVGSLLYERGGERYSCESRCELGGVQDR